MHVFPNDCYFSFWIVPLQRHHLIRKKPCQPNNSENTPKVAPFVRIIAKVSKWQKNVVYVACMANTTFTTWADLYQSMPNKLASRDFSKSSATIAGNVINWTTVSEFLQILEYVKTQAAMENGAVSLRVYVRDGGRG